MRVTYVLAVERGDKLEGDAFFYHHGANLLADGKGFIDPYLYIYGGEQERVVFDDVEIPDSPATALPPGHEAPTAAHPPAWTVTLAFFSLLGLRSVLAHQLVAAVIGSAGAVLIAVAAREVARGRRERDEAAERRAENVGLVAGGIASVYAFLFLSDGIIMSETLVVVVVALCTIAAMRFWRTPSWGNAAVLGAAGGLAALTRGELVLYVPIVAALALLASRLDWRTRALRYAACGAVAVAVVAPWVIRNNVVFKERVFLTSSPGTVLVQTNCDATYGGQKLGYFELYCGLPQPLGPNGEPLDESQRDVELRSRAFDYMKAHTRRLVTVAMPARLARMFALYDPVQTIRFDVLVEGREFRLSALGLAQYYPIVALAAGGAWLQRRRHEPIAPVVTWIGLVALTALATFGNNRYRVSAEPAFVALAAVALHDAVAAIRRRRAAQL
ncbi:MAG TPA: glycosyltransferase family 39 protein [Acidimicrobiales bacterium]